MILFRAQKNQRSLKEGRRLMSVPVIALLLVGVSGTEAQTKVVWSSFGSGMNLSADKSTTVISVIGEPLVGAQSGGSIVLSGGFVSYILGNGGISKASDLQSGIPLAYTLSQNYPNPFNPSTVIAYALPKRSEVRLRVFNILGQEVATLYEGEQPAGFQRVQWNADVSTGVYIYMLEATSAEHGSDRFVQVKKMMYLK